MLTGILTVVIFVTAILAVIIVLMQPTKSSGGLGGLGGASGGDSVLGTNRNEVLSKMTWWLMAIFVFSCLTLSKIKSDEAKLAKETGSQESVFEKENKALEDNKDIIDTEKPAAE